MGSERGHMGLATTADGDGYKITDEFKAQELKTSDTPNTHITDVGTVPDISMLCEECQNFVNLSLLRDHRTYHRSLVTMRYTKGDTPKTVDALTKRRYAIVKKIKMQANEESPFDPKKIKEVNDAYEYLKSELDGSFGDFRRVKQVFHTDVRGKALNCSTGCVSAVGICSDQNDKWKQDMEDSYTFQDSFGDDTSKSYFGVFDGHHGRFAAEMSANELHHLLSHEIAGFDVGTKVTIGHQTPHFGTSRYNNEPPAETRTSSDENAVIIKQIIKMCEDKFEEMIMNNQLSTQRSSRSSKGGHSKSPFDRSMEEAFVKVYYLVDILLSYGKDECSKVRWSGTSLCTILITDTAQKSIKSPKPLVPPGGLVDNEEDQKGTDIEPPKELGKLYLANAGDVQAMLVRGNKSYMLTKCHNSHNLKEKERVLRAGGDISNSSKNMLVNGILSATRGLGNHGDKKLKQCVTVEPHTQSVSIDQYAQFIVIASKGIWEVFTEREVMTLLLEMLPCNYIPGPSRLSVSIRTLLEEVNNLQSERSSRDTSNSRCVSFSKLKTNKSRYGNKPGSASSHLAPSLLSEQHIFEESNNQVIEDIIEENIPEHEQQLLQSIAKVEAKPNEQREVKETAHPSAERMETSDLSSHDIGVDPMNLSEGEDSGNEGDIDTDNELSLPPASRLSALGSGHSQQELQRELAKTMAEHLTQAAIIAGATDNITAMVILLPGSGI